MANRTIPNISTDLNEDGDSIQSAENPHAPLDERLQKALDKALYGGGRPAAQKARDFLNGTWLGNPLHAALTDLPIGAWTTAMAFDILALIRDRHEYELAADTSIAFGLACAVGAAVTGATDWSDVDPPARRIGLIHGLLNLGATALFTTSLVLRKKRSRARGRICSALGYAVITYAAHLGGRMAYNYRVGVDRTAGQVFPTEFVAVLAAAELEESKPTRVVHRGVPILLVRRGTRVFALAETCSHFSGPLAEGKLEDDCIVCPYHYSRFALEDGHVINGPAVHPQPCLEVQLRGGQIEVRQHVP